MVRSNSVSGDGRSVLCESLESRQFFNATIGLDPAFNGGQLIKTNFGGESERAHLALKLKSGKLLVAGISYYANGTNDVYDAFAMYDAKGKLDKSFDGDGKLLLPEDTNPNTFDSVADKIVELNDGGILVVKYTSLIKLLPNGKLDTSFGTDGHVYLDEHVTTNDSFVTPDGNIRLLTTENSQRVVRTYDAKGKLVSSYANSTYSNQPSFTKNGDILVVDTRAGASITVSRYDNTFQPLKSFNYKGVAYLTSAYKAFITAYKFDGSGLLLSQMTEDADGSLLFRGSIDGQSPFLTSYRDEFEDRYDNYLTPVFVKVSADGKTTTVLPGEGNTSSAAFFANDLQPEKADSSTTIYTRRGQNIDVKIPGKFLQVPASFHTDNAGGYYVVGEDYHDFGDNTGGFLVGHIKNPLSNVFGTLFNDANVNGKFDAGEKVNAGVTVYIDDNNNAKLDPGEVYTVTNSAGQYTFTDLGPDNLKIRQVVPAGYRVTTSTGTIGVGTGIGVKFYIGTTTLSKTAMVKDLILA